MISESMRKGDDSRAGFVSVIMPNFNGEKFIEQAIGSVLRQTYGNFELVIVDDGSTDNSVDIIHKYLGDSRYNITLKCQSNSGVASARNCGISIARGELVSFIDSDDYWHPRKLETQLEVLHTYHDAAACFSSFKVWSQKHGVYPPADMMLRDSSPLTAIDEKLSGYIYGRLFEDVYVWTSTFLGYKKIIDSLGGFDEFYPIGEDYDLWLRIAASYKFVKCAYPLALYRMNPASLTREIREKNYELIVIENAESKYGLLAPDGSGISEKDMAQRKERLSFNYGIRCFWSDRPDLSLPAFRKCLSLKKTKLTFVYWLLSHKLFFNITRMLLKSKFRKV